jgi:hypothetical protein
VRNSHGKHTRGAPKGHQKIKRNDKFETPFETAVRELNEEVIDRNLETQQWDKFDRKLENYTA